MPNADSNKAHAATGKYRYGIDESKYAVMGDGRRDTLPTRIPCTGRDNSPLSAVENWNVAFVCVNLDLSNPPKVKLPKTPFKPTLQRVSTAFSYIGARRRLRYWFPAVYPQVMLGILDWFLRFDIKLGMATWLFRNVLVFAAKPKSPKKNDFVATPATVWFFRLGPPAPWNPRVMSSKPYLPFPVYPRETSRSSPYILFDLLARLEAHVVDAV
jgi:hypothetical protein